MLASALYFLAPVPVLPQMTNLKASLTQEQPRGFEVTSGGGLDGKLGFLLEGATIAILNMDQFGTGQNEVIDRVNLEYPNPMSVLPYYPQGSQAGTLFIAGGASGLWQMSLCPSLLTNHTGCSSGYDVLELDSHLTGVPDPVRKVCIDLAIIAGNASHPLPVLVAVYAAIGDASLGGPSELRLFSIGSSTTCYARVLLPTSHPSFAASKDAIAYAVTGFSGLNDWRYAYVACGTAGIVRVNVDQATPNYVQGPAYTNVVGTAPQRVRDVTMVVNPSTGLGYLYAALDYGGLVEIRGARLTTLWTDSQNIALKLDVDSTLCETNAKAPAHRIAAAMDATNSKILIALATDTELVSTIDHGAPIMPNGFWGVDLVYGLNDPGAPSTRPNCEEILFYRKSSFSSDPQLVGEYKANDLQPWGWQFALSLGFTGVVSPQYYTYETRQFGFQRREIKNPFVGTLSAPTPSYEFDGEYLASLDGAASKVNPGVTFFTGEAMGDKSHPMGQVFLDRSNPSQWKFTPIPNSTELCAPNAPGLNCYNHAFAADISLYNGSIFGVDNWVDPYDPEREWFFIGTNKILSQGLDSPPCPPHPPAQYYDPCSYPQPVYWNDPAGETPGGRGGWKLVSIAPCLPNGCGSSPNASNWGVHWWQIPSEYAPGHQGKPQDYRAGIADPRLDSSNRPVLLHATRANTGFGYVIFRMSDLQDLLHDPVTLGLKSGNGDWIEDLGHELQTHVEFNQGCVFPDTTSTCLIQSLRACGNYRLSVWKTSYNGQDKAVCGVCVGYAANAGDCLTGASCPPQCPGFPVCPVQQPEWYSHYGEAMVVFYDVSDPGLANPAPSVKRVGLVPASMQPAGETGRTWAIATKSYGSEVFAFVIDVAGKLYVFDVSPAKIYGTLPYSQPPTHPDNVLVPTAVRIFEKNPYDGKNDNGIDAVIQGNYLYVAMGRGGVGIFDITVPTSPVLTARLETPGLAEGLAVSMIDTVPTLFVGDTRAGIRVYQ